MNNPDGNIPICTETPIPISSSSPDLSKSDPDESSNSGTKFFYNSNWYGVSVNESSNENPDENSEDKWDPENPPWVAPNPNKSGSGRSNSPDSSDDRLIIDESRESEESSTDDSDDDVTIIENMINSATLFKDGKIAKLREYLTTIRDYFAPTPDAMSEYGTSFEEDSISEEFYRDPTSLTKPLTLEIFDNEIKSKQIPDLLQISSNSGSTIPELSNSRNSEEMDRELMKNISPTPLDLRIRTSDSGSETSGSETPMPSLSDSPSDFWTPDSGFRSPHEYSFLKVPELTKAIENRRIEVLCKRMKKSGSKEHKMLLLKNADERITPSKLFSPEEIKGIFFHILPKFTQLC